MIPEAREMERNYRKANVIAYHVQKMHTLSHEARFTRLRELFDMGFDTIQMVENNQANKKKNRNAAQEIPGVHMVDRVFKGKEEYL